MRATARKAAAKESRRCLELDAAVAGWASGGNMASTYVGCGGRRDG